MVKNFLFDGKKEYAKPSTDHEVQGIEGHPTATYTPQDGGNTEEMHGTIKNGIRMWLIQAGAQAGVWEAYLFCVCNAHNGVAHPVCTKTAEELLVGVKPKYRARRSLGAKLVHLSWNEA